MVKNMMKLSVSESGVKFLKKYHEERKMEKDIEASIEKEQAEALAAEQMASRRAGLGSIFVNSPLLKDRKSRKDFQISGAISNSPHSS